MTSAYGSFSNSCDNNEDHWANRLPYIPYEDRIKDGSLIRIDVLKDSKDIEEARKLLNDVIEDGMAWPFEKRLSEEQFRTYFLSHAALIAKTESDEIVGAFYCKPNFPDRCSHYCNGGFITHPNFRGQGIGYAMGKLYLRVAKDLGYKAVLFNLVFETNITSIRLWEKLGFERIATLPKVGRLRVGYTDAYQYYYDLQNTNWGKKRSLFSLQKNNIPLSVLIGMASFLFGIEFHRRFSS